MGAPLVSILMGSKVKLTSISLFCVPPCLQSASPLPFLHQQHFILHCSDCTSAAHWHVSYDFKDTVFINIPEFARP